MRMLGYDLKLISPL